MPASDYLLDAAQEQESVQESGWESGWDPQLKTGIAAPFSGVVAGQVAGAAVTASVASSQPAPGARFCSRAAAPTRPATTLHDFPKLTSFLPDPFSTLRRLRTCR